MGGSSESVGVDRVGQVDVSKVNVSKELMCQKSLCVKSSTHHLGCVEVVGGCEARQACVQQRPCGDSVGCGVMWRDKVGRNKRRNTTINSGSEGTLVNTKVVQHECH